MNKKLIITLSLFAVVGVLFGIGLVRFLSPGASQKLRLESCKSKLLPSLKDQYLAKGKTLKEKNTFHDAFAGKEYTTYLLHDAKDAKVEGLALVIMSGEGECSSEERNTP